MDVSRQAVKCPICEGSGLIPKYYDIETEVALEMLKQGVRQLFVCCQNLGVDMPDDDWHHYTINNLCAAIEAKVCLQ